MDSINDYIQLFFYDKEQKRVVFDIGKIKELDEREFKKFV